MDSLTGHKMATRTVQQMALSVLLKNSLFSNDDVVNFAAIKENLTKTLLDHVAYGLQDEAKAILVKYPEILLEIESVIDIGDEPFKGTAFQYAVWALDTHMYTMMLDCLPQNEQGEFIRKKLLKQFEAQTEHFDFKPLITALDTYVDNYDTWDAKQREEHWCKVVGGAQQKLPAHVRHEYCNPDRSFYPVPDFTEKVLTRSLRIFHWDSGNWMEWGRGLVGLGVDFAIALFQSSSPLSLSRPIQDITLADAAAMRALCQVRTADLDALRERLQRPIQKLDDVQGIADSMVL
ncbi:hypothetical protein [Legionella quateirensis]|nr:hypothetical protein [Legionella quateirensis]